MNRTVLPWIAILLVVAFPHLAQAASATIYCIDPVDGNDTTNAVLSPQTPFKTVGHAIRQGKCISRLCSADTLRLRADVVHPPTIFSDDMVGTEETPIVVDERD